MMRIVSTALAGTVASAVSGAAALALWRSRGRKNRKEGAGVSAGNGRHAMSSRPQSRPGRLHPVLLRLAAAAGMAAAFAVGVAVAARSAVLHDAGYAVWLVPLG